MRIHYLSETENWMYDGKTIELETENILIATGSKPLIPEFAAHPTCLEIILSTLDLALDKAVDFYI
ncbi:MAG: hypothetical protein Q7J07_06255 [Pelolinea sp.]|nr:hypothetical protein [Pelolinea sp.]